ncbi:MAG TPA: biosynthetic peptidoglycan transglycosylase [Polyangiaceae bacterium]|nr:biosynthetic peptidoglycan transglycosylase [Polyangiaceae bacterium]
MKRGHKIAGALALAAVLGGALSFGPAVRAKARSAAVQRGLELDIDVVRPGTGRVWLRGVRVRVPELPSVQVELHAVEVRLGAWLSAGHVAVHGGTVRINGPLKTVRQEIAAYRAKRPRSAGAGGERREIRVEGLNVVWDGATGGDQTQKAWGVRYARSADGEEIAADLIRIAHEGVAISVQGARLDLDLDRKLRRLGADGVSVALDTEKANALRGAAEGPGQSPPPRSGQPEAQKEREKTPLLARYVPLDDARGARVRRTFSDLATLIAGALPAQGEVDLDGVRMRLHHRGQRLALGPARVSVKHDGKVASLRVAPTADAPQPLSVALKLPLAKGEIELAVAGGPVPLKALCMESGDLGIKNVDEAKLELNATLRIDADAKKVQGFGNGKLSQVDIFQKWLSKTPVRKLEVGFRVRGSVALDGSRLDVEEGELKLGKLRGDAKGFITREKTKDGERARVVLEGGVPLASCQTMLDSLPEGLAPLLAGMQASGTFSLTGRLQLDTDKPEDVLTRWNIGNECRITSTPPDVSPQRFKASWTREVRGADGRLVQIQSGPGTPTWAPRHVISKHMDTAVLICEDGRFYAHGGFDQEAIRNSIRENLKAGRFLRGASTISMQLAKNLYLPRDKTLSRKLQEAVLTQLLEQQLTKDEIMELYLNVIEFGPGIYGIGAAAAHYFNAAPHQLSLGQSLYLASVLPSPKRHYFGADGRVTPGWMGYLRRLMRIGVKIRRVTEAELADALQEEVTFKVPYSPRVPNEDSPEPEADPYEETPTPAPMN